MYPWISIGDPKNALESELSQALLAAGMNCRELASIRSRGNAGQRCAARAGRLNQRCAGTSQAILNLQKEHLMLLGKRSDDHHMALALACFQRSSHV